MNPPEVKFDIDIYTWFDKGVIPTVMAETIGHLDTFESPKGLPADAAKAPEDVRKAFEDHPDDINELLKAVGGKVEDIIKNVYSGIEDAAKESIAFGQPTGSIGPVKSSEPIETPRDIAA